MIYDEGMDVQINEHRFTAFFRYFPQKDGMVMSNCGKTIVGWYENSQSNKKSCFRADKIVSESEAKLLLVEPLQQISVVQPKETITMLQRPKDRFLGNEKTQPEGPKLHREFKDHHLVVDHLNKMEKSWTAGVHNQFADKSFAQLNSLAGRTKNVQYKEGFQRKTLKNSFIQAQDLSDLPKAFDWASKIKEPRQQKECGSCYVFATMKMLEARIDIKFQEDIRLSPQHVLDCSFHNQGCGGGYPFLVNKFASQFELVPESCSPYLGVKGTCSTCNTKSLAQKYKVSTYG